MMVTRWWLLTAALVVVLLGASYLISQSVVRPYAQDQLRLGGGSSEPARVGQTVFFDLPAPARREGAHITGVRASVTSGLAVKIVSTTFRRTGQNDLAGYPLSCAGPASVSRVAGTPLNASTYLRLELTPTRTGTSRLTSLTVDWRDGIWHGSATTGISFALRAIKAPKIGCA
jgi:hypothetical protein